MNFADLGLSDELLKSVAEQGYEKPSPIQEEAIPAVLQGRDVMAAAQTGTGKTAAFTLPLLQILSAGKPVSANQTRALILTPTRELAAQIADNVALYRKYLNLKSTVVFGGVKINPQMKKLLAGTDILVATPGRLMDLYQQNAIKFDELEVLVLDEADRMLDMGFIRDIQKIIRLLPAKRQNLLFSATFSDDIRALAKDMVNNPLEVSVTPKNSTAETITQFIYAVDKPRKPAMLCQLIKDEDWQQVLVFSRTKHGANKLVKILEGQGITAAPIHGNKSQGARTRALADFKFGKIRVLVATDIAARGIDISLLPHVVNFDLPNVPEDYVHRIGRTGRAGSKGEAISLVCEEEFPLLKDIERLITKVIPRKILEGFEPNQELPASPTTFKPIRGNKPKKSRPRSEHQDGQRSVKPAHKKTPGSSARRKPSQGNNAPASESTGDKAKGVWAGAAKNKRDGAKNTGGKSGQGRSHHGGGNSRTGPVSGNR